MRVFRQRHWLGVDWTFSRYEQRRSLWGYTPPPEEKRIYRFETETGRWKGRWRFGVELSVVPDNWEPKVRICLSFIGSVWITVIWPALARWLKRCRGGEWELELTMGDLDSAYGGWPVVLRWQRGGWSMEGTDRSGSFDFTDWLLGRVQYKSTTVEMGACEIIMPEGRYPASYKIEACTRKRPRTLRGKTSSYFSVEIPGGVPVPGKGENSWDIDDDCILGIGTHWGKDDTVRSACHRIAMKCLADRCRHGSLDWVPDAGYAPGEIERTHEPQSQHRHGR